MNRITYRSPELEVAGLVGIVWKLTLNLTTTSVRHFGRRIVCSRLLPFATLTELRDLTRTLPL